MSLTAEIIKKEKNWNSNKTPEWLEWSSTKTTTEKQGILPSLQYGKNTITADIEV